MMLMPDTNAWINFLNPGNSMVKTHFAQADASRVSMCSIVLAELFFGAYRSSRTK